jgi:hypothetical protein
MKNLFDILGAHPDDDAEKLKNLFRKAVKANHPDLRIGDPNASMRIRRIIDAYAVLRDEKKRRAYEQRLSTKRGPLRSKPKRAFSCTMFNAVFEAIVVVGVASVLVGGYIGYMTFGRLSEAPINLVKAADERGYQPPPAAAVQSASRIDTADRAELNDIPVGALPNVAPVPSAVTPQANGSLAVTANGQAGSGLVGREPGVARPLDAFGASVDQPGANIPGTPVKKEFGMKPLDRNNGQSLGGQLSSAARNSGTPKPSLAAIAISGDKHDLRIFGKPRMAMNPRSSLVENGSAPGCFGFFTGRARPLFGAAF